MLNLLLFFTKLSLSVTFLSPLITLATKLLREIEIFVEVPEALEKVLGACLEILSCLPGPISICLLYSDQPIIKECRQQELRVTWVVSSADLSEVMSIKIGKPQKEIVGLLFPMLPHGAG